MGILRYTASADNTITNAFNYTLATRGSGSNMGYADSLEVFSIYGQASSSTAGRSEELSRALIQFPTARISADRTANRLPASGNVSFYLKMSNAETPFTLPQDFTLTIAPVSRSWTEGTGLDMDEYKDLGYSNWMSASSTTAWTSVGGDYRTASNYNVTFPLGYEDLEVDVSYWVEEWIKGTFDNYGFGIHLTASEEAYHSSSTGENNGPVIHNVVGSTDSYYTKKFFARSSEYFFKRPVIEARWDSRIQDDRENFMFSSSLAPAADNLNTLYFYNYVRGRLVNIPAAGTGKLSVSFYSSSAGVPTGSKLNIALGGTTAANLDLNTTASYVSPGIYSCSVALTAAGTPLTAIHDVWHSGGVEFSTGSFYPEKIPTYDLAPTFDRVTSCRNLKKSYSRQDNARFRFFIRSKNWSPTVYLVATANNPTDIVVSASYAIHRVKDNYGAIPYGTGSDRSTYTSYDKDGNYFDLDMSLLEAGYMYELKLSYYNDSIGDWQEQPQTFKFRVEE
jgi:hypothetical protein|tara:strand:- start:2056 stop:3576 length:1521 start_codon:yes stop_codon:yes gene_type:complete